MFIIIISTAFIALGQRRIYFILFRGDYGMDMTRSNLNCGRFALFAL